MPRFATNSLIHAQLLRLLPQQLLLFMLLHKQCVVVASDSPKSILHLFLFHVGFGSNNIHAADHSLIAGGDQ